LPQLLSIVISKHERKIPPPLALTASQEEKLHSVIRHVVEILLTRKSIAPPSPVLLISKNEHRSKIAQTDCAVALEITMGFAKSGLDELELN
jgi:hypothetical protein